MTADYDSATSYNPLRAYREPYSQVRQDYAPLPRPVSPDHRVVLLAGITLASVPKDDGRETT